MNLDRIRYLPEFDKLASRGRLLSNYKAVSHPSFPNYLSLISGSTFNITDDNNWDLDSDSLMNLLDSKGIDWLSVQENYPDKDTCYKKSSSGNMKTGKYVRKHNPFMSFLYLSENESYCTDHVKSNLKLDEMIQKFDYSDQSTRLPQFIFYTPNQNNNGHDTTPEYTARYLEKLLAKFDSDAFKDDLRTLFVFTYDEDDKVMGNENRVFTAFYGFGVEESTVDDMEYNHYSFLKTVELNFGLDSLNRLDAGATAFRF